MSNEQDKDGSGSNATTAGPKRPAFRLFASRSEAKRVTAQLAAREVAADAAIDQHPGLAKTRGAYRDSSDSEPQSAQSSAPYRTLSPDERTALAHAPFPVLKVFENRLTYGGWSKVYPGGLTFYHGMLGAGEKGIFRRLPFMSTITVDGRRYGIPVPPIPEADLQRIDHSGTPHASERFRE